MVRHLKCTRAARKFHPRTIFQFDLISPQHNTSDYDSRRWCADLVRDHECLARNDYHVRCQHDGKNQVDDNIGPCKGVGSFLEMLHVQGGGFHYPTFLCAQEFHRWSLLKILQHRERLWMFEGLKPFQDWSWWVKEESEKLMAKVNFKNFIKILKNLRFQSTYRWASICKPGRKDNG